MKLFQLLSAACLTLCLTGVHAQTTAKTSTAIAMEEDDLVPDLNHSTTNDYKCELNDSFTIYTNSDDDAHVALRWKSKLYRLKRIETTTGANRFENKKAGLVWINIPSKSMLLDSRHGQQLANECKTSVPRTS